MDNLHVGTALCCTVCGSRPFHAFYIWFGQSCRGGEGEGEGGESPEWQAEKPIEEQAWARICKRLMGPGIDSEESSPPAYVAGRAGKTNLFYVPSRQAGGIDSWAH